ncbi:MAG: adenylate kinase [Promethearchaeota archaeon]|nr:MAG: adenylate kinase [Candidatus Lokiarchaeota archaeon]
MKFIVISGTPGTGKTTVSKNLSNFINAEVISLNEVIIERNFVLGYDQQRETSIIDEEKLMKNLSGIIKDFSKEQLEYLIIEGHFTDIIPEAYMDFIIILRCHPDELFIRLKKRGYKKKKIIENIQSEILGSCVNYFIEKNVNLPLYEIDTTNSDLGSIRMKILDIINKNENISDYYIGKIDWLESLSNLNRLDEFFY